MSRSANAVLVQVLDELKKLGFFKIFRGQSLEAFGAVFECFCYRPAVKADFLVVDRIERCYPQNILVDPPKVKDALGPQSLMHRFEKVHVVRFDVDPRTGALAKNS